MCSFVDIIIPLIIVYVNTKISGFKNVLYCFLVLILL
nr:MAG TPA: hypothetical protein [Caudoviricetes sp.]